MKKINYPIVLLMALIAGSATAQPIAGHWHNKPIANESITQQRTIQQVQSEAKLVLEEDFSLFTKGSEEAPDAEDISNSRYYVKNEYTHEPYWIGYNVHQAGGACALLEFNDPDYGKLYGHISTPERELYGDVVIKFRARRAHSNPTKGQLWLALCNNLEGVIESTTIQLTQEWADYEWAITVTDFAPYSIFQFTPQKGEILLDDISITRNRNIIPAPNAINPINNSPSEFVARWNKSDLEDIDGYLLNVYYKDWPEELVGSGSYSIDFESINLLDDGKSINTANPGYPEGWTIDVSSNGHTDMRTDEGFYNSGKQAIFFDAPDDIIKSPITPAPIKKISFWIRPTDMTPESYDFSLVGVQVINKDGYVDHIANLPNYWMEEQGGFYEFEGDVIGAYVHQVIIFCESSFNVQFAIDDITIEYEDQTIPYDLIVDRLVTDTFCVISDIDPTKEHYYNVRVKEGDIVSEPSEDVWVDGLRGVVPTALPASDITATSFTANWEAIYTASNYKLDVNQTLYTLSNNEEVVIVHEDFSGLTEGSILYPHDEWDVIYDLNDHGRTDLQWQLTSPQWVDGMAGSRGTHSSGLAGLVASPLLQMGDFDVRVDVSARNTQRGDTLWVIFIEDIQSPQAVAGQPIAFPTNKTGLITETVYFNSQDWGDKPLRVAFMSQMGTKFYIDEAKVSFIVPQKGSAVTRPYAMLNTEETSATFDNIPDYAPTYTYNVIAKRNKLFIDYISERSETITVTLPTAINSVSNDNSKVFVANNVLHIQIDSTAAVTIYNTQGMLVAQMNAFAGTDNTYTLPQGIYIVKVADKVFKVVAGK